LLEKISTTIVEEEEEAKEEKLDENSVENGIEPSA
jgi:hypothetical protein